jgi:multicomponent Na+:H+ antiporter subunit G
MTDTLGAGLILIGLMCHSGLSLTTAKLAMILAFLLICSPTSCHALAESAISEGLQPLLADKKES